MNTRSCKHPYLATLEHQLSSTIRGFLQQSFPFFYKKGKDNLIFSASMGLFTFTFLTLYQPFDFNEWDNRYIHSIYYSILGFSVFISNILLFKYLVPSYFKISNLNTIFYYTIFTVWNTFIVCLVVIIFNYFCVEKYQNDLILCIQGSTIKSLYMSILHVSISTGILRILQLKSNINKVLSKNSQSLLEREETITIQADTKETLTININDLLFAQAQDNYTLIYWQKEDEVQQHLMRVTLKKLEKQLADTTLQRCHRSYVVNLNKVVDMEGNVNKMYLKLAPIEHKIPVSRSLGKKFKQSLTISA